MSESDATIERLTREEYRYGFVTDIEQDTVAPGLSEEVVRLISAKKEEPEWLLEWRLKAYARFCELLADESLAELAAMELRAALDGLAGVTDPLGSEEVLDQIFAEFCIGK